MTDDMTWRLEEGHEDVSAPKEDPAIKRMRELTEEDMQAFGALEPLTYELISDHREITSEITVYNMWAKKWTSGKERTDRVLISAYNSLSSIEKLINAAIDRDEKPEGLGQKKAQVQLLQGRIRGWLGM